MFLSENEISIIKDLQKLRSTSALNSKGNKVSKRMFLNGVNDCKFWGCRLEQSRTGSWYFVLVFDKQPMKVWGKKEYFDRHEEYIFYPHQFSKLVELCAVFGHELKPIPDGYNLSEYLNFVAKRLNTFRGRELNVTVRAYTEEMTDNYGKVLTEINHYGNREVRTVNRATILNFNGIIDWNEYLR